MADQFPHYHLVPKDPLANLKFRRQILIDAADDQEYQQDLAWMCREDLLFWLNTFGWTYDPRNIKGSTTVPFISYQFQDQAFGELEEAWGIEDLVVNKSRDMGASWCFVIKSVHRWQFFYGESYLFLSRTENLVDDPKNPASLFWKIDFLLKYQPSWLVPQLYRNHLNLVNLETLSTINGSSTTPNAARGDRKTAILFDEFAAVPNGHEMLSSSRDTTSCRVFNSTPKGTGNAFYDIYHRTDIRKLNFHWTQHPTKAAGLYYDDNGDPRSPWYDLQCRRAAHPMEIAQELDMDFMGSDYQFFDQVVIDSHKDKHARPPCNRYEIEYNTAADLVQVLHRPKGHWLLWVYLDNHDNPPKDRNYVIGVDIAVGSGASNSVISVVDCKTGEKVAEFAHANIDPVKLAFTAIAAAKWFKGPDGPAFLIWEANGPGIIFSRTVIDRGYRNIFYRSRENKVIRDQVSDEPGFYMSKDGKNALLGEYRRALADGHFINRSVEALRECSQYIYTKTGSIEHAEAINNIDPTGARANHGDRVIADALACRGLGARSEQKDKARSAVYPVGSFGWRMERRKRDKREAAIF